MTKKIKIIISIIIVAITLTLIFNKNLKYFNKVDLSEADYLIYNSTEMPFLDSIVKVGLMELGVTPDLIVIKKLEATNTSFLGDNTQLLAFIRSQDNQYLIKIIKTNRKEAINIISHELIHLKQLHEKRLINGKSSVMWKGKEYTNKTVPEYIDREWEIEAIHQGKKLEKVIKSKLYQ